MADPPDAVHAEVAPAKVLHHHIPGIVASEGLQAHSPLTSLGNTRQAVKLLLPVALESSVQGSAAPASSLQHQHGAAAAQLATSHNLDAASRPCGASVSDMEAQQADAAVWKDYQTVFTNAKAGMEGVDKEKVQRIVYEMSKDSAHFKNEQRKQQQVDAKIARMKQAADHLSAADLQHHTTLMDQLMVELESRRDMSRVWLHVDMDAFFASVEELDNPALKDVPMAVGGLGMISTANYVARKFGVRSAMPGFIGRRLCPQLVFVQPDFAKYTRASAETRKVFAIYDPEFEAGSLDEAYLDVTDYCRQHGLTGSQVAEALRKGVRDTTGLTCSCGVAPNKMLAKVCSDINKPDNQFVLHSSREAVLVFVETLPVRKIPGIGKVTEQMLKALGITQCGHLLRERGLLSALFSSCSCGFFLSAALGLGGTTHDSGPEGEDEGACGRKGISCERTFRAMNLWDEMQHMATELTHHLADDMAKEGIEGKTLTVKLKATSFEVRTRAVTLKRYVSQASDMLPHVLKLIKAEMPLEIRLMGVRMSGLRKLGSANNSPIAKFFKRVAAPDKSRESSADPFIMAQADSSTAVKPTDQLTTVAYGPNRTTPVRQHDNNSSSSHAQQTPLDLLRTCLMVPHSPSPAPEPAVTCKAPAPGFLAVSADQPQQLRYVKLDRKSAEPAAWPSAQAAGAVACNAAAQKQLLPSLPHEHRPSGPNAAELHANVSMSGTCIPSRAATAACPPCVDPEHTGDDASCGATTRGSLASAPHYHSPVRPHAGIAAQDAVHARTPHANNHLLPCQQSESGAALGTSWIQKHMQLTNPAVPMHPIEATRLPHSNNPNLAPDLLQHSHGLPRSLLTAVEADCTDHNFQKLHHHLFSTSMASTPPFNELCHAHDPNINGCHQPLHEHQLNATNAQHVQATNKTTDSNMRQATNTAPTSTAPSASHQPIRSPTNAPPSKRPKTDAKTDAGRGKQQQLWACLACTFAGNRPEVLRCDVCNTLRGCYSDSGSASNCQPEPCALVNSVATKPVHHPQSKLQSSNPAARKQSKQQLSLRKWLPHSNGQ